MLITHSRTRPSKAARFFVADGPLSLWRDTAAATAFAGVHREAVKARRDGGWFSESWFARFAIEAARGSWRGVEAVELTPAGAAAPG